MQLSQHQTIDLLMILGAAKELFRDQGKENPGFFGSMLVGYAERAEELSKIIAGQHNEAAS